MDLAVPCSEMRRCSCPCCSPWFLSATFSKKTPEQLQGSALEEPSAPSSGHIFLMLPLNSHSKNHRPWEESHSNEDMERFLSGASDLSVECQVFETGSVI